MNHFTLSIGFAFGLRPDGSPGPVNEALADRLRRDLAALGSSAGSRVSLQWELADALDAEELTDLHVVPPPSITADEILAPARLLHRLQANEQLMAVCPPAPQGPAGREALAAWCERLLADRWLFARLPQPPRLADLHRPEIGPLGVEERRLPDPAAYPTGLRRYQARRVNRLILEALLPPDVLRRGRYLNTREVAACALAACGDHLIAAARVYAHPAHRPWCGRQLAEALQAAGQPAGGIRVSWAETDERWDRYSAQHWCRTAENWAAYRAIIHPRGGAIPG